MNRQLEKKIGMKLKPYTYKVELCKIRELLSVISNTQYVDLTSDIIPVTFPTVIEFWGAQTSISSLLGLNPEKVLHGQQDYEYLGKIIPGDNITVYGEVEDIYVKASMNFIIIKKEFVNQKGETVVIGRSVIIERQ